MSNRGRPPPDSLASPPAPIATCAPAADTGPARARARLLERMLLALALGQAAEQVLRMAGYLGSWPPAPHLDLTLLGALGLWMLVLAGHRLSERTRTWGLLGCLSVIAVAHLGGAAVDVAGLGIAGGEPLARGQGPLLLLSLAAMALVGPRTGWLLLVAGVLAAALPWLPGPQDLGQAATGGLKCRPFDALTLAYCGAAALCLDRLIKSLEAQARAQADTLTRLDADVRRLREVFERAPVGLAVLDPSGRYALVNRRLRRLLGAQPQDLIGCARERLDLVAVGSRSPWGRFARALPGPGVHVQDAQLRRRDGTRRWCQLCLGLVDPADPGGWAVLILMDLGRRKGSLRGLAAAHRAAVAENRRLEALLGTLSHDLRSPLQSILGFCDTLARRGACTASDLDLLLAIRRNGRRLLALVECLLDRDGTSGAVTAPAATPCDLHALLAAVAADLGPRADAKGLGLRVEVRAGVPVTILIDSGALLRVLTNLLDNALRLTERGEVVLRAGVSARPGTDGACGAPLALWIEVQDSGPGIRRQDRRRIFTPFQRLTGAGPGTGLGLAICRRLATDLGGTIRVRARPDLGSCFRLSLPQVQAVVQGRDSACRTADAPRGEAAGAPTRALPTVLGYVLPSVAPSVTPADRVGSLGRAPLPPDLALGLYRLLCARRLPDPGTAATLATAAAGLAKGAGCGPLADCATRLAALGARGPRAAHQALWDELVHWVPHPPPPAALAQLRECADLGLVTRIEDWCIAWCEGDGRHRTFAREVLALAYRFDRDALLAFVDAFLAPPRGDA